MKTFGDTELKRLSSIIASGSNTHLKSISASGHSVSASTLSLFGRALASPNGRNIRHVAIGSNDMKDEGIMAFCEPLVEVRGGALESVDFTFKNMTRSGAEIIGRTFGKSQNMKRLDLYRNPGLGDQGMIALSDGANIQREANGCFRSLEHLDISECDVGPDGLAAIVTCLVNGKDVMGKRRNVLDFYASNNPIGEMGCVYLKKLISHDNVDVSILRSLTLQKCSVGDNGISLIAEALQVCRGGLDVLDVSDNGISQVGANSLGDMFRWKSSMIGVSRLILANNPLGSVGVESLAKALTEKEGHGDLELLDLSGTNCGIKGMLVFKCRCGSFYITQDERDACEESHPIDRSQIVSKTSSQQTLDRYRE
jgi:hypothetical protein